VSGHYDFSPLAMSYVSQLVLNERFHQR